MSVLSRDRPRDRRSAGSSRLIAALAILLHASSPAAAETLRLKARDLFARSVSENLRLSEDGASVELERGELLEDDGPAAGFSYKPNEERLSDTTWIKKDFLIADPRANRAVLLVGAGGRLKGIVNGKAVELSNPGRAGQYWQAYDLSVELLKAGKNEVILHGSGKVWIARDDEFALGSVHRPRHANRSAKSADAGKSWDHDRLGVAGNVDGEYYVRLVLDRYRSEGVLTMPVLDAANLAARPVHPPVTSLGKVHLRAAGEGKLRLRARSGNTYVPDARWSVWRDLGEDGTLDPPGGRYLQIAAVLGTANPLATPRLEHIEIEIETAADRPTDWTKELRSVEVKNAEIVRTSIPFRYERFDHPRLQELRRTYMLDDVVAGAKSEFEMITRLAAWSSRQWQRGHLREAYPPWDALEILKPHADRTPVGGFCQQYNLVFLQACESFGFPGRAVSLGSGDHGAKVRSGHEVVEIWSNEHQKWVYVDGQFARYHIDEPSGQPLSLWELRRRQLALFRGKMAPPVKAISIAGGEPWEGLKGFPPFFEMRMIPRSDFLEHTAPLPLNQGMRGWFWTGHYVWMDSDYPASFLYDHRISSRRNWDWTLNQTHVVLEATETDRVLRVHLDTETPGFETFVGDIDRIGPSAMASGGLWRLHAGLNRLEVRSRNRAGREGIVSRIVLEVP